MLNIYIRKINWKTFTVQYNGCLQMKFLIGKIKVTLVKAKRVLTIHGMTDLQIRDKVRLTFKAKIVHESNTQDEEDYFQITNY